MPTYTREITGLPVAPRTSLVTTLQNAGYLPPQLPAGFSLRQNGNVFQLTVPSSRFVLDQLPIPQPFGFVITNNYSWRGQGGGGGGLGITPRGPAATPPATVPSRIPQDMAPDVMEISGRPAKVASAQSKYRRTSDGYMRR